MSERRFCLDCHRTGEMDRHGRCGKCGSEAVVVPWEGGMQQPAAREKRACARGTSASGGEELQGAEFWVG